MQTIAIVNQKGGVGKSTTAVNLGAGLVRQGKRVLLIDADSQANLTEMLGWQQPDELSPTLASMLEGIISALSSRRQVSCTTQRAWTYCPPTSNCPALRCPL